MIYYYAALQTKSHAFLLEQRMKQQGIRCELAFVPREIMKDLCSMGVKFDEQAYEAAVQVIKNSGLPGCKLYRETVYASSSKFMQIPL